MPAPTLRGSSKTKVDIIPFETSENADADHELSQIRELFADGMRINNAPEDYIQSSLRSDLRDASSMRKTYFSGRGTFFAIVEDGSDDGGGDAGKGAGRRNIVGMAGLQDLSSRTGAGGGGTSANTQCDDEGVGALRRAPYLCELRRMSVRRSCRRSGHGTTLVRECVSHARRNGFDGIELYTGAWMEGAIAFYVKMGFEDVRRVEYKNTDGTTVTIARLEMIF